MLSIFLLGKTLFLTKVILFKLLSKIFKDFCRKFKDFSRISYNFSIFKDFSRPVRNMLSVALTAWPHHQGLFVRQYGGSREEKTLLFWFAANKLEKREKTLGTRLLNNRLIVSFYPILIIADGFYETKRFCDKLRTFIRLRLLFFFPFSFGVSTMNSKSNEGFNFMPSESVSKNSPLPSPVLSLFFFSFALEKVLQWKEQRITDWSIQSLEQLFHSVINYHWKITPHNL